MNEWNSTADLADELEKELRQATGLSSEDLRVHMCKHRAIGKILKEIDLYYKWVDLWDRLQEIEVTMS